MKYTGYVICSFAKDWTKYFIYTVNSIKTHELNNIEWVIYWEDYKILSCNLHHAVRKSGVHYLKFADALMKLREFKSVS